MLKFQYRVFSRNFQYVKHLIHVADFNLSFAPKKRIISSAECKSLLPKFILQSMIVCPSDLLHVSEAQQFNIFAQNYFFWRKLCNFYASENSPIL